MPNRQRLTLAEWSSSEVVLDAESAELLRRAPGEIKVEAIGADRYRVTPSHFVGSLVLPRVDVLIRPKIGIRRLFFMLGYARRLDFGIKSMPLDTETDVTEVIVRAFLEQARTALRRGPMHAYRSVDDALATVRGRVRLGDQVRRRFAMPLPMEVVYDEFAVDIPENQILKAALRRTERMHFLSAQLRSQVHGTLSALQSVSDVSADSRRLPAAAITRLNRHYEVALSLARVILASFTADLVHGRIVVPAFVIDMDKVFEDFVFHAIGAALGLRRGRWRQGAYMKLDDAGRITLKPDLSIWIGTRCAFVGDVKYKLTDFGEHSDLYQVLAYAHAAGLSETALVYASASSPTDRHVVRNDGTVIHVLYVDLGASEQDVLAQIWEIADLVRRVQSDVAPERPRESSRG